MSPHATVLAATVTLLGLCAAAGAGAPAGAPTALEEAMIRGESALRAGRRGEAEAQYGQARFLGYATLGDLAALEARFKDARAAYALAVAARPQDVAARRRLAQATLLDGALDDALVQMEEARALFPDDAEVLFDLALSLIHI